MDIWLVKTNDWTHIRPASVHGMLWLQTHFINDQWETLAMGNAKLPTKDAENLSKDAEEAGLSLHSVESLVKTTKF